eukprot:scaffold382097_cov76-Cyclotella_meneghiniana.AAC.2
MAVLDQTRGSGGSSAKIKKLIRKLDQDAIELSKPTANSKTSDSNTVKTTLSCNDIGPLPEIPSSLLMQMNIDDDLAQPYQSPYATTHFDSMLGLKNLQLQPESDSKSMYRLALLKWKNCEYSEEELTLQ